MSGKQHTLQAGEWIGNVAQRYGVRDWAEIWDHERNAELRALRGHASLLIAGDTLFVPDPHERRGVPVETGQRIVFRVKPRDEVRLRIADVASYIESFGAIDYEATAGDVTVRGQLTEDAQEIAVPIRPGDEEIEVRLLGRSYVYRLGDVGPASDRAGAFERLRHLGFVFDRGTPVDARNDLTDAQLRQALLAFQRAYGLAVTGELDEHTQAALAQKYGV